jgi:MFS family permease
MENIDVNNGKTNKLWSKEYISLMISNFFLFFGDNLLLPVLPVYVKQHGANDFQVGVVAAVFFVTSILMRIFTSRASARVGKRTLLMLGLTVFTLAMLGYYLFASIAVILILRLIQGIGFGSSSTLYSTTAANILPFEKMGEGIGYYGLGVTIACALGPCLGAAAVSLPNYKSIFLFAALFEIIGIILSFFIKVDNSKEVVEKAAGIKGILSEVIEPKVLYQSVFLLLVGLATGGFNTYVVLFSKERNINNIFVYFLVLSLAEFFVRLFSGKLYDKKGANIVAIPGAIAGIVACIVMGNATNLLMVAISAFLCGGGSGMVFPVMEANAMQCVTPERRIAANATLYNFMDLGMVLGPILFGAMIQQSGYQNAFFLSALIYVAMLLIIALNVISKKIKTT